jgi:hypothetical protein
MDWVIILQAGIASGTVLLFATIGEVLAERSGILNLGLEGMMLIGAMSAYSVAVNVGSPWLGLVVGMATAGLLALLHGFVTIHLQADQVVSGLSLTFLGTGLSMVFGEGLSQAGAIALLPRFTIPALSAIPFLGDILFTDQSIMVYLGYLLAPAAWYYINHTRPGMHLRAVGEYPAAADTMGINVYGPHDHLRSGMDRYRPDHFCPVGPAAGGGRLLRLWRATAAHFGPARSHRAARSCQPILLQPLLGHFPQNDPLRLYRCGSGGWLARGDAQTDGCAGGIRNPLYSWRAWAVVQEFNGCCGLASALHFDPFTKLIQEYVLCQRYL